MYVCVNGLSKVKMPTEILTIITDLIESYTRKPKNEELLASIVCVCMCERLCMGSNFNIDGHIVMVTVVVVVVMMLLMMMQLVVFVRA